MLRLMALLKSVWLPDLRQELWRIRFVHGIMGNADLGKYPPNSGDRDNSKAVFWN